MHTLKRASSRRRLWLRVAHLASAVALILKPDSISQAQYSPNCQRNGRKEYCAITPLPASSNANQTVEIVTFADHSVYELRRDERSCKQRSPQVRICIASIAHPPGHPSATAAIYRGTAREGSYTHHYGGQGIQITTTYLD